MLIASPVAQLYINNEEFDTIFCIGNFLSFFSPKIKNLPVECRIAATNSKGIFLLKKTIFNLIICNLLLILMLCTYCLDIPNDSF